MTLSHWWQILTLYEVVLVWPLALAAVLVTARSKSRRRQLLGVMLIILLFTPFFHRWAGDLYFDYLCKNEAGEFIYRTVDNVEGILQMRPRDGSKDYFDRMAAGDIPEDPWGHTNAEASYPWTFLGSYSFFETKGTAVSSRVARSTMFHWSMKVPPVRGQSIARFFGYDGRNLITFRKEFDTSPKSLYGYTWMESRGLLDRLFNVHGGEVHVVELRTEATLAVLRGFYRSRPVRVCPPSKDELFILRFLQKVLKPVAR